MTQTPEISVVIPLYNEVENVDDLCRELKQALCTLGRSYEVLLVDDGSKDGTGKRALELAKEEPTLRVLRLRQRNQRGRQSRHQSHAKNRKGEAIQEALQWVEAALPVIGKRK